MVKFSALLLLIITIGHIGSVAQQAPYFSEDPIFLAGDDGYACFRIPAIIKSPNGDILAVCEGRKYSCSDDGKIDIVMKRSTDNGQTWTPLEVVASNGNYLAGNPGPVLDTMDPDYPHGRIFLTYIKDNGYHEWRAIRKGKGVREVMVTTSSDNGFTWSAPTNITAQVHRPHEPAINPDYTFAEDWRWYAITPGHCLQLTQGKYAGRLVFPANHSIEPHESTTSSMVFYTDDHGKTWRVGTDLKPTTNEATAVELANGNLMINTRNWNPGNNEPLFRTVGISNDGGQTWQEVYQDEELPESGCQAAILRYSTTAESDKSRILFSNPATHRGRHTMTVRLSYDEGETWPISKLIRSGGAAYSDMVVQDDGKVGLLYELNGPRRGIYYARFNLEWLTDEKDYLPD